MILISKKLWYGISALLISAITLYLYYINKIGYFINSNYYWYLLVSVITIFIFTVIYFWYLIKNGHKPKPARYSQYIFGSLLFCIFVSLFIVPIKPLGAESANYAKRGNSKKAAQKVQYIAKSPESISSLSLIDWYSLATLSPNPNQYNGQKAIIKGFVSEVRDGGFDLSQYQVSCCVVDASLYTIPVKTTQKIPAKDTWLNVEGQFEIIGQKPNIKYQLNFIKSEVIATPDDPYKSK
ncbi:MAG: TIGR03943 family protein [candidate division SR1 bacterium]|nr:TIGR03943 family protein [candidate division SR1 bacterium]